jgi:molybdopterin-containing oxidoreductase family iron-sulfur binding subunit
MVGTRANGWAPGGQPVEVRATGGRRPLASIQIYHDLEVPENLRPSNGEPRPIIQETTLPAFIENRSAGEPHLHEFDANLWPELPRDGNHWAMAIDLSACTGCSGCVVACQVENNIPAVGRDEIRRQRDMYWMRIDRYYSPVEDSVDVVHQPMLCHHCDNAPCESVCPVAATVHSEDGLNQQVYNRCVGTRYCANNCPFKVRRFNWFDYSRDDEMENLVLNPDVTVRSRGVMEKCSFCVQRIQGARIAAKSEGRGLVDGEVTTACQQSCPADAIVFGDLADSESEISRAVAGERHYRLFEDLNILPSVGYQRLVRNREGGEGEDTHG